MQYAIWKEEEEKFFIETVARYLNSGESFETACFAVSQQLKRSYGGCETKWRRQLKQRANKVLPTKNDSSELKVQNEKLHQVSQRLAKENTRLKRNLSKLEDKLAETESDLTALLNLMNKARKIEVEENRDPIKWVANKDGIVERLK